MSRQISRLPLIVVLPLSVWLVVGMALAGCADADGGAGPARRTLASDASRDNGQGSTDAASPATGTAEGASAGGPAPPKAVELAFDVVMPTSFGACVEPPVGECHAQLLSEFRNRLQMDPAGDLMAVGATLTWTPSSPLTQTRRLAAVAVTESGITVLARAAGPSPLSLDLADVADVAAAGGWPDGAALRLSVGTAYYGTEGSNVGGAVEQPFRIEGTAVFRSSADAAGEVGTPSS